VTQEQIKQLITSESTITIKEKRKWVSYLRLTFFFIMKISLVIYRYYYTIITGLNDKAAPRYQTVPEDKAVRRTEKIPQ